ncbi:hypothetical protein [Dulcicalothrix desertica]|uniref:hypothetical protein n=1 Tax=Dulcicalothrix desertica TaxID=32056 RepID=UPI0013159CA5|nr:hypothetical protein [Dulcicalothrix desertica]
MMCCYEANPHERIYGDKLRRPFGTHNTWGRPFGNNEIIWRPLGKFYTCVI